MGSRRNARFKTSRRGEITAGIVGVIRLEAPVVRAVGLQVTHLDTRTLYDLFFEDDAEKIIYIGKAKNLKNRVRSYFNKNQN